MLWRARGKMDGVNPVEGVEVKNSSELVPPTSYNLFSLNSQGQPVAPIKAAQPSVGSIKSPIDGCDVVGSCASVRSPS